MIRVVLAVMTMLALVACQPSLKIDAEDPWASLHPWNHNWKEVQKLEITGEGNVTAPRGGAEFAAMVQGLDGSWLTGGTLKWTSGANAGETSKVVRHSDGEIELTAAPKNEIQQGDTFAGRGAVPVEYVVIRNSAGQDGFPNEIDQVEVHYEGRFAKSGEVFDSSYDRGETATFPLNGVIKGWTKGLQRMQPGDEFMFWIPWQMAYGEAGRDAIGPRADLMFRVELFNVIPAVSADPTAWAKVTPWPTNSSEVQRRPTGLEYLVVKSGDANEAPPTDRDFVYVHLEGRLEDGSVVDTTYETQSPLRFPMADLTPGWSELMKMMRPGDHWMVRMPPHLMYAEEGDGRIPPSATVIFEVRLDTVIRIDPPADDTQDTAAEPSR